MAIKLFEKRMLVYEGLFRQITKGYEIISPIFESNLSKDKSDDLVSEAIFCIATYCDEHAQYLGEEIIVHSCTIFIGAEDVVEIVNQEERGLQILNIRSQYKQSLDMIKKEIGLKDIDRLWKKALKVRHKNDVINQFRQLKDKQAH